jgi:hypothetical protein
MAASTPCCGEAKSLEGCLVLWVYSTTVLERWHLLAGLVVVVLWLCGFGSAILELAKRTAFGSSSQDAP